MDALGRLLVDAADDVLINGLRHERDHRRGSLRRRHERRVERHVGIDLILALALRPEALAAAAHIPVAQFIDETLQGLRRFRDLVGSEVFVDRLDHRVEARQNPLVHDGKLLVVERMIERIEIVDIGIEHIEGIGIPQRAHELSLPFLHGAVVVAVRQPRCAVLIEVPADRIRTVLPQRIHRIDGVALRLRHLSAVLVLHMAEDDDVLVRRLVKEQRRDGDERIEPTARLIDCLGDEVRREAALKDFLVLERIVPLRKRHRAGVEPAVDDLGHAVHLLAALGAADRHGVDVGAMQLKLLRAVVRQRLQLLDRADRMLVSAAALPYIERRAPVAVAADAPVLHMLKPVAEASLADALGNPVDRVIVRNQFVAHRRHLDEPRLACVVDERRVAAPAMRIAVLEDRRLEETPLFFQVLQNQRIGVLDEDARPVRVRRHLALCVNELHERHVVLAAHAVVVLAERRRRMDDARAVGRRDIVVAYNEECLLLDFSLGIRIERLIIAILKLLALHARENLALALDALKDRIDERFREIVDGITDAQLHVGHIGIDAETEVRRQRPRRRRPGEEVRVLPLRLELDHGGTLFDVLVALRDLVRGKWRAAARAVRHDLVSLVEQTALPDLLQGPPLRLDEVILVGDVRMLHIGPEADDIGELLPHALVLPDGFAALLDERLHAVLLDLILAVESERLLHLKLHRQAVRVPARFSKDALSLHRLVARQHVLDDARQHMADVRLAVRRRRPIIEREVLLACALVNRLLCDVVRFPEFFNLLLALNKIQRRVYLLVQQDFPSYKKASIPKQDEGALSCQLSSALHISFQS